MTAASISNAFTSVRPKAQEGPTKPQRGFNRSDAPREGSLRHLGTPNRGEDRAALKEQAINREVDRALDASRKSRFTRRRTVVEKARNVTKYNAKK